MTIESDIARLREALEAGPTPGPWFVHDSLGCAVCAVAKTRVAADQMPTGDKIPADAEYIAAASPEVARALLAAWDDAQRYRRWREAFTSTEVDPLLDMLQRHAWTPDEVDSFIDAARKETP